MILFKKQWFKAAAVIFIVFIALGVSLFTTKAESSSIKRTAEFTSESSEPKYDGFPSEIEENGYIYKLGDMSYTKLGEEKKTVLQDKTTTVSKSGLKNKSYSVGGTENITVDGKSYVGTVLDVKYTDNSKYGRKGEVNGSQDYGLRVDKPTPPSTKTLPYYDGETGNTLSIEAPLTKPEQTDSKWQDYTHIDIVVSNYTDTQFMFNNKIIHHNGTSVLDSSYYSELLSMAGLTGSNYKVSSVNWSGDSYMSGNVRYRNARANIQAYSCSYKAHYYKSFSLPDVISYNAEVKFKYSQENVLKTIYKYRANAYYVLAEKPATVIEETKAPDLQKSTSDEIPITIKTITTISLILVLSLAFVLTGFFLLTKIKGKDTKLSKLLNKKRRK